MSGTEAEERARIQAELQQILNERAALLKERMRVELELEQLRAAQAAKPDPNLASSRRAKR